MITLASVWIDNKQKNLRFLSGLSAPNTLAPYPRQEIGYAETNIPRFFMNVNRKFQQKLYIAFGTLIVLIAALFLISCGMPTPPPQPNVHILGIAGITRTIQARVYVADQYPASVNYNRPYAWMTSIVTPQNTIDIGREGEFNWSDLETSLGSYQWTKLDDWSKSSISVVLSIRLQSLDTGAGIADNIPSYITQRLWLAIPGCPTVEIPDYGNATLQTRWQSLLNAVGAHLDSTPDVDQRVAAIVVHVGVDWSMRPALPNRSAGRVCDYESIRQKVLPESSYVYAVTSTIQSTLPALRGASDRSVYVALGDGELSTRAAIAAAAQANHAGLLATVSAYQEDGYQPTGWGSVQAEDFLTTSLAYAARWAGDADLSDIYYDWQATGSRFPDLLVVPPARLQQIDSLGLWGDISNTLGFSITNTRSLRWVAHDSEITGDAPGDYARGLYLTQSDTDAGGLWIPQYIRGAPCLYKCAPITTLSSLWSNSFTTTAKSQVPIYARNTRRTEPGHNKFYLAPRVDWVYDDVSCHSAMFSVMAYDNGVTYDVYAKDNTDTQVLVMSITDSESNVFVNGSGIDTCWAPGYDKSIMIVATNNVPLYVHSVGVTLQ